MKPADDRQTHEQEPAVQHQFGRPLRQHHPLRILLAEDNIINRKVAVQFLERIGYRVDIAADGLEVLEALQRRPYDVVLMDVEMPELDGFEAARRIHLTWSAAQRPRIIAMTAHALQGDRENCLAAGMDDYISKPLQLTELANALEQCQPRAAVGEKSAGYRFDPTEPRQFEADSQADSGSAATDPSEIPAIDLTTYEKLRSILGGGMATFVEIYLDSSPELLARIQDALNRSDGKKLADAAHSLKPVSANLGAMTLAALCQELEKIGESGALEQARDKVVQLEAEFVRVKLLLMAE